MHERWSRVAGRLLGIASPASTDVGYIATLIAWRRDTVQAMKARIEAVGGRDWLERLAGTRDLSECTIYGRFVDEVEDRPDRHAPTGRELCAVYWEGAALDAPSLRRFLDALAPDQVAAGLQSFTGTDPTLIRRAAGLA